MAKRKVADAGADEDGTVIVLTPAERGKLESIARRVRSTLRSVADVMDEAKNAGLSVSFQISQNPSGRVVIHCCHITQVVL